MSITLKTDSNCPTGLSIFPSLFTSQQPPCIIPSYSFFFLPHYDTILHIAVIILFYIGFPHFFKVISNFIFYNYLNSIHKLIYDRENTMSKYRLFSFSFLFMPFFLTSQVAIFFFSFAARLLFLFLRAFFFSSSLGVELFLFFYLSFFFLGPCVDSCVSSFFLFFFLGAPHFVFLVFGFFFFSFFLGALCFLSLLPSPEQAV